MYPGRRKMVQYNFQDHEISDVIAFLKWISEMDLNGFPAEPDWVGGVTAAPPTQAQVAAVAERPKTFSTLCIACHALGGSGGVVGPALDGVGLKYDRPYLEQWLSDPQKVKPGTTMPKLPLTQDEIQELVSFLADLK
jgi:nitric oxide reductase subunit C